MTKSRALVLLTFLFLISATTEFPLIVTGQYSSPDPGNARTLTLAPHKITLQSGQSFTLNLPKEFEIAVAAEGLKRVRFMTESPDHRIFVTDMYNLTDNRKGVVYILDEFDEQTKKFKKVISFITGLRNPNSVAFFTDDDGVDWLSPALCKA